MSKIGDKSQQRGFTLLELLVVLSIMGLAMAIVVAWLPSGVTQTDVLTSAKSLASGLRTARSRAIHQNRTVDFLIDPHALVFQIGAGEVIQLNKNLDLSIHTVSDGHPYEHGSHIRFFADGSSSGGRIELHHHGGRATPTIIAVDWLTGNVTISN